MASVAKSTHACKLDVIRMLDSKRIEAICQKQQYRWREGKLGPAETIQHFAWQILMGNESCDAVKHHANGSFTASAYCQARQRLPLEVLTALSREIVDEALAWRGRGQEREARWLGHRVFRIDGTGASLPDCPEVRAYFGCSEKQKPGCGYPTAHVLLLTGPGGVAVEAICSPMRTSDIRGTPKMHLRLEKRDILLGDGLFNGWGHLSELSRQDLHGVFPIHHSRTIGWGKDADGTTRRLVKCLGWRDQLVEYKKPQVCPKWMDKKQFKQAPPWLLLREISREVKVGGVRRQVTVVSTLLDHRRYPAKALVKLLAQRWLIETQIRWLKTSMGLEELSCQSVEGVKKELLIYLIVYNLIRLLLMEASRQQGVPVDRLSFADALARLRYGNMEVRVKLEVVTLRPDRLEPRVIKRRRKAFMLMNQPREQLRQQLQRKRAA
jgi:hypothetical protein